MILIEQYEGPGMVCVLQAVVGKTIFDEEVTSLWWTGMVLILSGLVLLHLTNAQAEKTRKPGTLPRKKDKLF